MDKKLASLLVELLLIIIGSIILIIVNYKIFIGLYLFTIGNNMAIQRVLKKKINENSETR